MKRLGQHFLKSKEKLNKLASIISPASGDFLIEIGPGHGELTDIVLKESPPDSSFLLIEKDFKLARSLKLKYQSLSNVEVLYGDALVDLLKVVPASGDYKIYGNIPYYISGSLMRLLGEISHSPSLALFTVQKEIGERICASSDQYNQLAAAVNFWGNPSLVLSLPKSNFSPPPKVDSVAVLIKARPTPPSISKEQYEKALKVVFKQPRKTLANNLVSGLSLPRLEVESIISACGLPLKSRPQNLSFESLVCLSEKIFSQS